jgi:hypothetical protein
LLFPVVEAQNSCSVLYVDLCFEVRSRAMEWAEISLWVWRHGEQSFMFMEVITFSHCVLFVALRLNSYYRFWLIVLQLICACLRLFVFRVACRHNGAYLVRSESQRAGTGGNLLATRSVLTLLSRLRFSGRCLWMLRGFGGRGDVMWSSLMYRQACYQNIRCHIPGRSNRHWGLHKRRVIKVVICRHPSACCVCDSWPRKLLTKLFLNIQFERHREHSLKLSKRLVG